MKQNIQVPAKPQRETKISKVVALLKRKQGATLQEMMAATGWQPHTARAALTSLRKKDHALLREKRGDDTCLSHREERLIMTKLDAQLVELETMAREDLSDRWARLTGRRVPKVSTNMLRLALAYELQTKAWGGLPRKTRQRLAQLGLAKTAAKEIRPGMRLAREFGGTVHVVAIGEAGEVLWNEREWNSLSEVARAITGTRWSGPAFFGLREKRKGA